MRTTLPTLAALALLAPSGAAQVIVPEPPFAGTASEDFEAFQIGVQAEAFPEVIGGQHMIAVPSPTFPPFNLGPLTAAFEATNSVSQCKLVDPDDFLFLYQLPSTFSIGTDELDFLFSSPVDRFGLDLADFGNEGSGASFEVELYDADMTLLHSEVATNVEACEWNWHGWRSTGPGISRARFRVLQTTTDPVFLMYDDVNLDCPGCFASTYCTTTANSTGELAALWVTGSPSVTTNDLVLQAGRVPADKMGLFFFGATRTSVSFGNGFKCVGSAKRLPVTKAQGELLRHAVDLTTGSAAAIAPGSTWNFQAWFRDPAAGGAGTNLSTALSITFTP